MLLSFNCLVHVLDMSIDLGALFNFIPSYCRLLTLCWTLTGTFSLFLKELSSVDTDAHTVKTLVGAVL